MKVIKKIFVLCFLISQDINAQCWVNISGGNRHTLAITSENFLVGAGSDMNGQIGSGKLLIDSNFFQVGYSGDWVQLSSGMLHTLAIKENGTLWAWGENLYGKLGDGTTTDKRIPVQIGTNNDWINVSAGDHFSLGLKRDSSLWSWGENYAGQLGDGSTTSKFTPTLIGSHKSWVKFSAGGGHALAIKSDGTLWSWGSNYSGELGLNTYTPYVQIPSQVGTDNDWFRIYASGAHSLAIKKDGSLWVWGSNDFGELGYGSIGFRQRKPVKIGLDLDWKDISGGVYHSLALKSNGSLYASGLNSNGQLGVGDNLNSEFFVIVDASLDWESINSGYYFSIGIKKDSSLWTWGDNSYGQLGNGTTINTNRPGKIYCPITSKIGEFKKSARENLFYPNPAKDKIFFTEPINELYVQSIEGKVISLPFLNNQADISTLSNGIYIIRYRNKLGNLFTSKLLK